MEPYGKLVEVSPSVYEVRLKPECADRQGLAPASGQQKDADTKRKEKSAASQNRKPEVVGELMQLAAVRREDDACAMGIGKVTAANDTEIVVGFRKECQHLAASIQSRATASSFFSDFFFDEFFEEEITPRRSKQRRRRGGKCDETGFCTAMIDPPVQSLISRTKAPMQSRSTVAAAPQFWLRVNVA